MACLVVLIPLVSFSQGIMTLGTRTLTQNEFNQIYAWFAATYIVEDGQLVRRDQARKNCAVTCRVVEVLDRTNLVAQSEDDVFRLTVLGNTDKVIDNMELNVAMTTAGICQYQASDGRNKRMMAFRQVTQESVIPTTRYLAEIISQGWDWKKNGFDFQPSAEKEMDRPAKLGRPVFAGCILGQFKGKRDPSDGSNGKRGSITIGQ